MHVARDTVVQFHYSVAEPGQPKLESSFERDPLVVLVGHGGIIPGLENALIGKAAGERFSVNVEPDQGYGPVRENFGLRVPKKHLKDAARLKPGMQTMVQTNRGPRLVTVQKIGMSVIDVDLNHPMAGKTLEFEVEVLDVRAASAEELQHGHAHGPGGHQH